MQQGDTRADGRDILSLIERTRVIGIIRADAPDKALRDARRLLGAGIEAIEISLVTPGALAVIDELTADGVAVGVGTALHPRQVAAAADAGARFVVSPDLNTEVIRATLERGLVSVPGAGSVTEALAARRAGAHLVKLFPATTFGPHGVRGVLASVPSLPLAPTGGVTMLAAQHYLRAGAVAVGMGSALVEAAESDPEAIRNLVTH
ncbi:2-dehydro-3-deoxyphosphogluconate aldolase/(4S)-4-hydroxy-2-oxoglutarate aldolase [Microbacterium sp. SLBN-154]|uniref:bifunctional 4-hydroxy-2-oxoglutarate aldolase/2-dehydro-3-deoxy-phosphogluconate aldolase n=1 Tax=Microbacterium sp. SLBN-154 TaxID=2768458 RepID=UPI0011518270|nr:bifunctional 4-hydroxy-2-oxoglutarate aldolase/2-dehydro-3-deoxy-phosphogluconate aldolase [Microbacterium sp. SLBN-154]TQK17667.1 2-dehydro-3-deoxyphosphogluconate aldolase/(4S)-4-hydroxy-2-oxoglutarate aldolase [Microbacterium sp. SLBN-154]